MTIPTSPIYMQRIRQRAKDAVRRIGEKPVTVVFRDAKGIALAPQVVRIEYDNSASASESAAGAVSSRKLVIFGVAGHESMPDSDIKKGYRFVRERREYEVVSVIYQSGELQAVAQTVG
jgi:hypothetical protein